MLLINESDTDNVFHWFFYKINQGDFVVSKTDWSGNSIWTLIWLQLSSMVDLINSQKHLNNSGSDSAIQHNVALITKTT